MNYPTILVLLAIIAAISPSHAQQGAKSDLPNVIIILTDDQRFNTLSALGNDEISTPNFDRLVRRGTTFTQAHIMGGSHAAVCMPSRAMLLTGRTLYHLEGWGASIPTEHTTIGEHFQENGYFTCHVGKWHNDKESHHRSWNDGRKIFGLGPLPYKTTNAHWHTPVYDFNPDGDYPRDGWYHDPPLEDFPKPFQKTKENGRHSAEVLTDGALDFLVRYEESAREKPFLMYLAHLAPHDPRQYPAQLTSTYNKETVSLPDNFITLHPFDNGELTIRDELLLRSPRFPDEVRQEIADYYAIISHLDSQIGRLLDYLESSGLEENTLIVLAGDNGLALGQHGLLGKQNVYEHSVRVPLIFAGPGIPQNERRDQFCYLTDIFPTLCELLGLAIPETVEGQSLLPIIEDNAPGRDELWFAYRDVQRAVKTRDYKLIEYVVPNKSMYLPPERRGEFITTTQLFHLQDDPLEMNNLADDPAYQTKVTEMRARLKALSTKYHDNWEQGETFWKQYEP